MEIQTKKMSGISLLALSMLMTISTASAMEEVGGDSLSESEDAAAYKMMIDTAIKAGVEAGIAAQKPKPSFYFSRKMILASLFIILPFWHCYRKTPKAKIPASEEYSSQEIRESLKTLLKHYTNKTKLIFRKGKQNHSDEEVKKAYKTLWKNIKNLYNMGIVGQKKYQSLQTVEKGHLPWSEKTPARGICGNLFDMIGDAEKVLSKYLYLIGAYALFNQLLEGGCYMTVKSGTEFKMPGASS